MLNTFKHFTSEARPGLLPHPSRRRDRRRQEYRNRENVANLSEREKSKKEGKIYFYCNRNL